MHPLFVIACALFSLVVSASVLRALVTVILRRNQEAAQARQLASTAAKLRRYEVELRALEFKARTRGHEEGDADAYAQLIAVRNREAMSL